MEKLKKWIRNWEGIHGIKKDISIPARVGKHYCPVCRELLQIKNKSRVVNSESEEAKDYDFSTGDTCLTGNIKFIFDVFYCAKCNMEISVREQRAYERTGKKPKTDKCP